MGKPLRVLIVEDWEDDALLIVRELKMAGFTPSFERVETPEAMRAALAWNEWDVVISDYRMPYFSGPAALQLLQDSGIDLPFILVSGTVGEDVAVAAMRAGAHDYLLKGSLARLGPAVERELREAEVRRQRRRAEEALRESEQRYRCIVETANEGVWLIDAENRTIFVNRRMTEMLGYTAEEMIDKPLFAFMDEEARAIAEANVERHHQGIAERHDFKFRRKEATELWAIVSATPNFNSEGRYAGALGMITDITERKRAEETLAQRTEQLEAVRAVTTEITRELDLGTLLDLIHRRAAELVGAVAGAIFLWDEAAQALVSQAWSDLGPWMGEVRLRLGEGVAGTVAEQREGMVVNDYRTSPYASPIFLERTEATAVAAEPLLYRDRLVGVIIVHNEEPTRAFTEQDRQTLALFAAQAAIAIENARLHSTTVRQLTELRALYDMGQAIASSMTLDEQLAVLVERLSQAAGAQRVIVGLLDAGNAGNFHLCLAYDKARADPWLCHLRLSPERYPEIRETIRTGRLLVIPDVAADPLLAPVWEHLAPVDLRSLVVMPLIVRERVIGAVSLGYVARGRTLADEELRLLQSVAAQAAIAIEKARLYEAVRQHAAELEVRVEERTRELETANQRLQDASRHKSEFLANMSHEIRTPLNSILGFSQLLLEQTREVLPAKQTRFLTNIHNSGQHLLRLINDILDLSKVEAGKFVLQPEPLPVGQTLEDILVIGRGLANKKSQEIVPEIEPDLPPLHADPVRFKQILFNLLSNAVKFTPSGGRITVAARRVKTSNGQLVDSSLPIDQLTTRPIDSPGDWLELRVTDTGIGIKAEDLPRLFQEFTQLGTTWEQKHDGTGLGLALTKKLLELHGGRIWAASDGEGRGSTFTVVLPFEGPRVHAEVLAGDAS